MSRLDIPLRFGGGKPPLQAQVEWVAAHDNLDLVFDGSNVTVSEVEAGLGGSGTLRATVTDGDGTVTSDLDVSIEALPVPDASWLLMAGIVGSTEYFARTRDAGVYSDPALMVPSNIDTSSSFVQDAGQFLKIGPQWFLAGTDTRVNFSTKGTVLSSFDLVNWNYTRLPGFGSRTKGIAFDGSRIFVSSVFGVMSQSLDVGKTWRQGSSEANEVTHGVYSPATDSFTFGAYSDDVLTGQVYDSMTLVDTPLTFGTTSDDIPSIAIDQTGLNLVIGNRRGEFGYSTNGGAPWLKSASQAEGDVAWLDIKHRDGSEFFAAGCALFLNPRNPRVARTLDGGVTWQIVDVAAFTPSGYINMEMFCCAYSDGKYFFGGGMTLDGSSTRSGVLLWTTDFVSFQAEVVSDVKLITALTSGSPYVEPEFTWALQTTPFPAGEAIYDVIYVDGVFYAVGTDNFTPSVIMKSTDGETWTPIADSSFGNSRINNITNDSEVMFVAVGASGKLATSTDDGETWTQRTSTFGTTEIHGVRWFNGNFVAVGASGKMAYSANGTFWTAIANQFAGTPTVYDVAFGTIGLGIYVAVASNEILTSSNLTTWTPATVPDGVTGINTIDFANGLFVAGASGGKIITSTDGINWSVVPEVDSGFGSSYVHVIRHLGGLWLAGAAGGKLAYSIDGLVWQHVADSGMGASNILGLARGIDFYVACGSSARITKSSNYP